MNQIFKLLNPNFSKQNLKMNMLIDWSKQIIIGGGIVLTAMLSSYGDIENPYVTPEISSADRAGPHAEYSSALSESQYDLLQTLVQVPAQDNDLDGYNDISEFLSGSDRNNADEMPEKFNLALSMAVDWTRDVDGNSTADLQDRSTQLGLGQLPTYLKYLSPTLETQFHIELVDLAKSLDYDPVEIYKWVYENIKFQDYTLARNGALTTLRRGQGNEYDQCSLLIALLRISGIPARYVAGGYHYHSVQGLTDEGNPYSGFNVKDVISVQAWLSPVSEFEEANNIFETDNHTWFTMVPWFKTTKKRVGLGLYDSWFEDGGQLPSEMDVALSYLLSLETPIGTINRDVWNSIGGTNVDDLRNNPNFPLSPNTSDELNTFEVAQTSPNIEDFGTRIRGYIHPPQDGDYVFYIAGDNNCELFLSSSADPTKKSLIAKVPGHTSFRIWNKYPDIGDQRSATVTLKANQRYYIEAFQKESGGGDHVSVAWTGPGFGTQTVIDGQYLSPYTVDWSLPENAKILEARRQLDPVEYFEGKLQEYINSNYPGKSLKDAPTKSTILKTNDSILPSTLPIELAVNAFASGGADRGFADLSEADLLLGEDKRQYADLEVRTPAIGVTNNLIGWWTADDNTADTSSTIMDPNGNLWHGVPVNIPQTTGNGYSGRAFAFNILDTDNDGSADTTNAYVRLADTSTNNSFGHLAFGNRTVAMWLKIGEGTSTGTHVIYEEGNSSNGLGIRINNGKLQARVAFGGQTHNREIDFGADKEGEWNHIGVVVHQSFSPGVQGGAGALQIFLNGDSTGVAVIGASGLQINVAATLDGAALGARLGQDVWGNGSTGDYFEGSIDDARVYNIKLTDADFDNLLGDKLLGRAGEKGLYLSQLTDRRLSLEFEEDSTNASLLRPRLMLDGLVIESTSKALLKTTPTDSLTTANSFQVQYKLNKGDAWRVRPVIRSGAVMSIAFKGLTTSNARINKLKEELQNLPTENVLSKDIFVRESYAGRMGSLLTETFGQRTWTDNERMDELMGVGRLHGDESRLFIMMWTFQDDPTGISSTGEGQIDNASALRLAAGWRIDARFSAPPIYDINNPDDIQNLADEGSHFISLIYGNASSYNEARIFSDWQGTPALSTIAGIFSAIEEEGNQVVFFNGSETETQIRNSLELSDPSREDEIVRLVTDEGATIVVPTGTTKIFYPDGHPTNPGEVAVSSDVYLSDEDNNIGWKFGQFDGGKSDEQIDGVEQARIANTESVNLNDFAGTSDLLVQQATMELDASTIIANNRRNEIVSRAVFTGGDPVDLVSGEFYLEEPNDIYVKSRGFHLSVKRKYKSQIVYDGPFGFGWTWNHGESLVLQANGANTDLLFFDNERRVFELFDNGDNTYTGPSGTTFQAVYNTVDSEYLITSKTGIIFAFYPDGRLKRKGDAIGNTMTYEYDAFDRMTALIDTLGRRMELEYNVFNKVVKVTDYSGRSVSYTYEGDDLIAFEDLVGNTWSYDYLKNQENPLNDHNLSKIILPNGDYLEIHYYKNDTVSHHRNKEGSEYHFQYSWYNRYTETWTEEGYYQKIFYNENWDVTRIATQDKTVEFREYDIEHNMTAMVDGRGNRTEYRYDDRRNLVAVINPLDETWVYGYEPTLNRKVVEIDPRGTVSIFRYNAEGQLEKAVAATETLASPVTFDGNGLPVYDLRISFDGSGNLVDDAVPAANTLLNYPERGEIRFTYDSFGNQLTQTQVLYPEDAPDPEVVIETENIYDIYGLNRVKSIDGRDNETEYFYDDLSRVVAVKDRAGYVTQTEYTDFDAVKKTVAADSAVTEVFYDENRRLVRTLLPNKGEVKTIYGSPFYVDHVDRVLHTIDPLGYVVSHEYDKAGRRVLTKDKNGNISRFKYDEVNRLIETINAAGDSMHYSYDGNGNRISITDYRGNTVRCEFDKANRKVLQRETWGDERAIAYEYDLNGNRTAVSRGTMSGDTFVLLDRTEITFDARNHVTKTVRNAGQGDRRITWATFDSIGRVVETIEGGYDPGTSTVYGIRRSESVFDDNSNITDSFIYGWDDVAGDWSANPIQATSSQYDARNLVSQSTDPNGTPTTYTYDPVGRVLTTTTNITDSNSNSVPHITDCTFDIMGNKVLVKSIVGTTEVSRDEYGYNLRNERVRHEDALGNIRSVVFDGNGNRTEATDPAGNITRTYFDVLNRVSASENALGQTTRREYDPNSNLVAVISPLNERTIYAYNENNERISRTDPVGNTRQCVFDKRGRKVFDVDPRFTGTLPTVASAPLPYTTKYHNNDFDEVYETFAPVTLADNTQVTVQTSVVFDAVGRAIETTDARDTVTQQDFDALDRVAEIRQAFGTVDETVTRNYFDFNSNLLLSIRAVGTPEEIATYTRFDEANRAIESTIGALQSSFDPTTLDPSTDTPSSIFEANEFLTSTTDYFDALRRVESTDPYGMSESTVTDALGRTTIATDKAGYVTTFNYDSRNNLIQTNFPVGSPDAPVINSYDKLNRVVSTTQAGDTTSRKFDASLRLIEEKDARGYITRHVYDKASRLIRTTRAVGTPEQAISKYEYDAANNRTAVIDANHSLAYASGVTANEIPIASYEYDELNRVVREFDASTVAEGATDGEITLIYDNGGLPIETYKRDDVIVERDFDALGRLKEVRTITGGGPAVKQQEYLYDDLSRMVLATDYNNSVASHTCDYTYDFASRVTDELTYDSDLHNPIAGRTVSTNWSIASAGDLSQEITKTYPFGGRGQIRKLDERGRIRFIENPSAVQVASFDYSAMNRSNSSEVRNSSSVQVMTGSATFDSRGREQNRVLQKSGTQFLNLATNYDASSNVDDETFAGTLPIVTGFKDYTLDPLNRLTNQDNPLGTDDLNWTLDLEGNWLSTNQNGAVENRTVNDDNEFDDIGSTVVDYDSNGNIVSYGDLAFSFDWLERMSEVRDVSGGLPGTLVASYSYDAANRRVKRTYNGVTTTYVYDGSQVVQELENGILARTFIYGSYVDAPVVMYDEQNSGVQYFYVRDRRANIVGLLDSSSNVVERYEYSPFGTWTVYNAGGVELTAGTAYGNPYGFTGRRWDTESDLWYYRNRMYSAELGRFLARDPAGFIDGYNVYAYVTNNPLRYTDPLGLFTNEGAINAFVDRYGDDQQSMEALVTVLSHYRLQQGLDLTFSDWDVDHDNRIIYIADDNGFFFERSDSNAAGQLHQVLSDEFYPVTGMSESWGGMGRRVGGGSLDTLGGGISIVGGSFLLATPEPTMLTKVGGYGAIAVGSNNVVRGVTSIFNREGGVDIIGSGFRAAGEFAFDDPTTFSEANFVTNFGFSMVGAVGTTSLAQIPAQSIPGVVSETFNNGLIRLGITSADDVGKIDFYVTPDGVAIPATGYRAVGGPAIAEAYSGTVGARPGGTYFTFDDLAGLSRSETGSFLQLPRTPSQVVSFNTLQLGDDLAVPLARWGKGPGLEPIVSAFPEYGVGGATQMITNSNLITNSALPILQLSDFGAMGTTLLNTTSTLNDSSSVDFDFSDSGVQRFGGSILDGIIGNTNGGQSASFVSPRVRNVPRGSGVTPGNLRQGGRGGSTTSRLFR